MLIFVAKYRLRVIKTIAMMKKSVLLSICLMTTLGMFAKGNVTRQLMDFGWQFVQNGKSVNVDLPHDWDIFAGPVAMANTVRRLPHLKVKW